MNIGEVKEAVERFIAIRNEEYYPLEKELNVLMSLACSYIAGEIGPYATEEEIEKTILHNFEFQFENYQGDGGGFHARPIFNFKKVAQMLVNKIQKVEETVNCPTCDKGVIRYIDNSSPSHKCPECNGAGKIPRRDDEAKKLTDQYNKAVANGEDNIYRPRREVE